MICSRVFLLSRVYLFGSPLGEAEETWGSLSSAAVARGLEDFSGRIAVSEAFRSLLDEVRICS